MEHVERKERKLIYAGTILDFYSDTMVLPNGKEENWDFVAHRMGAAAVVAVLPDGRIPMVRQYRPALDRFTWEIPAGARDSVNEDTAVTAARELAEETGYTAAEMRLLIKLRPTVAYCNEFIDVYLATELSAQGEQDLDEGEDITVKAFALDELLDMIYAGELQDSKTVSGILAYAHQK